MIKRDPALSLHVVGESSPASGRIAVIDIGSNSVRLVVYEKVSRSPVSLFNEKIVCGLGRGLVSGGPLEAKAKALALENLPRFVALARAMKVARLDVLATAAVREAGDGPAFVERVESLCGVKVKVLSGEDEARLSAFGVVAGSPQASGLMGDLGGGSLELVRLEDGQPCQVATFPLGTLRFVEKEGGAYSPKKAAALIETQLSGLDWLSQARGQTLYAVGGAWRALARLHIRQSGYPLSVIHQYVMERGQIDDLLSVIGRLSRRSLDQIPHLSLKRAATLPVAALIMERLLDMADPERVMFSGFGLREGQIYQLLDESERRKDPLIAACRDLAETAVRFGLAGESLLEWTSPLFVDESAEEKRLRLAACLLSDIAWREHPDYRAEQAYDRVLRMPIADMNHPARAFLALALFVRYGGDFRAMIAAPMQMLLGEKGVRNAALLGMTLRLANFFTGGLPALLAGASLQVEDSDLVLQVNPEGKGLAGETVHEVLAALANLAGYNPVIRE